MTTKLEHALRLANMGFCVFPLIPNTKEAAVKWRDESTDRKETIVKWWTKNPDYNVAIDTGKSGLCVIDVDIKNGKQGEHSFAALDATFGFDDTVIAITASGGRHHIYQCPDPPLDNSVDKLGNGLDIRGWGGYIVGVGSVIDGKEYTFFDNGILKPVPLPAWVSDRLHAHKITNSYADRKLILSEDKPGDIERAKHWLLNNAEVAVEGHGGDNTTFAVAAKLREFGVSLDTCYELMLDHWNSECSPPWDNDDLMKKVTNAYSYSRKPQGAASPHAEFEAIKHVVDYASFAPDFFATGKVPKRNWVFDNLALAKNVTVLTAPPGAGKSTFTLEIALSKATGKKILGFEPHGAGNVLLINNEDDMQELTRRMEAIMQHYGITNEDLYEKDADGGSVRSRLMIQSGENRPLRIAQRTGGGLKPKDMDDLIATLIERKIKLLIVDPFSETHPANENSNEEIGEVSRMYREVAQKADCGLILVHHDRKPSMADSEGHVGNMYSARGASSLAGVARIMFTFHTMSAKDCKKYGIAEEERRYYVRLDNAKANMTLSGGEPRWFKRVGEILGGVKGDPDSGESVGVLVPVKLMSLAVSQGSTGFDLIVDIEAEVKEAGGAGLPLTEITETLIENYPTHNGKNKASLRRAIQRMFDFNNILEARHGSITLVENKAIGRGGNKYFIQWLEHKS